MLRKQTNPIIVIFCAGLMAEFILPWAVIWFSDIFFFDIPAWSLWLLFGSSPAISLLAMLIHWALWNGQSSPFAPGFKKVLSMPGYGTREASQRSDRRHMTSRPAGDRDGID
jgi:hypothetical protein